MQGMLLNGTAIATTLRDGYKAAITQLKGRAPSLAVVLVGNNPASELYIKYKVAACASVGIRSVRICLPATVSEEELLAAIDTLDKDPSIDGILIQLPLPPHIPSSRVMMALSPEKDVDGFHPLNMGKLFMGKTDGFIPCTPLGIAVLLKQSGIEVKGKHVVIVGRSTLVGRPMAALLLQKGDWGDATVTVAHSHSENLGAICQSADILIAAIGHPHFITKEMVKEGAVVVDVGINRLPHSSKIVGDVDFVHVKDKCAAITPVPGGVGPMTIAMLLHNTLKSYFMRFPQDSSCPLFFS